MFMLLYYHCILCLDVDDFIVDEQGKSISEGKKKRRVIHDDAYVLFVSDISDKLQ